MLKTENWKVSNMEGAIRGMRNPKDSWEKHDSYIEYVVTRLDGEDIDSNDPKSVNVTKENFVIGPNDMKLAKSLCIGGPVHRKFLRQIMVSVDIIAPLYLWKEFSTYQVAVTKNSCSTMHTIQYYPITIDLISHDHMTSEALEATKEYLEFIEKRRQQYIATGDKAAWYDIIQMLPSSWNQRRTVTMNYETLYGMLYHRYIVTPHKLDEWHTFCQDAIDNCPYLQELVVDTINKELEDKKRLANVNNISKKADLAEKLLLAYEAKYGKLTEDDLRKYIVNNDNKTEDVKPNNTDKKNVIAIRTIAFKPDKIKDMDQYKK